VPRILYDHGMLSHFHTDIAGDRGAFGLLNYLPQTLRAKGIKRLLGRRVEGIPARLITAHSLLGLRSYLRQRRAKNRTALAEAHIWTGYKLAGAALNHGLSGARMVGIIGTCGAPLLMVAKERGLSTFCEQIIAPSVVERDLVMDEKSRFPHWESEDNTEGWFALYSEEEKKEWIHSDVILCGSEFVKEGVRRAGGPAERCMVVPYGISLFGGRCNIDKVNSGSSLKVLVVGTVGLRKGAPYVLRAAQALAGKARFAWAGHSNLSNYAHELMKSSISMLGHLTRSETLAQFSDADVFLLPSICEGSATVCYEALAMGIPVITTPNAGSVVRNGIDGFIVPMRDPEAIVDRVELLARTPDLLFRMGRNARERSKEFTLEKYGNRLIEALSPFLNVPQRQTQNLS